MRLLTIFLAALPVALHAAQIEPGATDAFGLPTWGARTTETRLGPEADETPRPMDEALAQIRLLGVSPGCGILLGRSVIKIGQRFAVRKNGVRKIYELVSVRDDGATVQEIVRGRGGDPETIPFVRETEEAVPEPVGAGPRLSLREGNP